MDVRLSDGLWASSIFPEGSLVRWFRADGDAVLPGDLLAEVRIEEALHEIVAPSAGRLSVLANMNVVIEPGTLIGRIESPQ